MRSLILRYAGLSVVLALIAVAPVLAEPAVQERVDPESVQQLTANNLTLWVLKVNPGLLAIQAAAEAAAYRIDPAESLDDPMLSYGIAPLTANTDRGLKQKLEFSQKFPWPGTLAARGAIARHEAVASDHDIDVLRLRVIAQTKSAYAEWRFIHSALNIHYASQALLDELIVTTQTRYAAGRVLKQDVLQAEIERTTLDKQLLHLQRLQISTQARINALLNRPPDMPLPAAAPIPVRSGLPTLQALQNFALAQHPDLLRLSAKISASKSRIILKEKAFYPDFQVGMGYNGLLNNADKRLIFSVSINIPLDRSKYRSELNRAKADKLRAGWSLVERRAELLSDLAKAHAEVFEAQYLIALYEDQLVPLATEYLEAAITDYQSGSGAFLNVIMAEKRQLSTDLALARARADYLRSLAALERWVGGSIDTIRPTSGGVR